MMSSKDNLYINGCSFTAGDKIDDKDTWPYKLSKLTDTNLFVEAKNGQSFSSIYQNTILHLSKFDNKNTTVVIGLTWPNRYLITYRGFNINVTPADQQRAQIMSKLDPWRRLSSSNYFTSDTIEFDEQCDSITSERENIEPIYMSAIEYIKNQMTYNPDYVDDVFNIYQTQVISLQNFLINQNFNYCFVAFGTEATHLRKLRDNKAGKKFLDFSKFLIFDITKNNTSHPTPDDCTLISKMVYELIL